MSDDNRRVELTPRHIRDLEEKLERQRSQDAEEANGAAHEIAGYLRSALDRRS